MKHLFFFFILLFFASCASQKSTISNKMYKKSRDPISKKEIRKEARENRKIEKEYRKKSKTITYKSAKPEMNDSDSDGIIDYIDEEPPIAEEIIVEAMVMSPTPTPVSKKDVAKVKKATITVLDKAVSPVNETTGLIAYSVPEEMKVGIFYSVKIRISKEEIKKQLIDGDNGITIHDTLTNTIVTIENVRVSNVMSAALLSTEGDYKITTQSTETQNIEELGYTEWEWKVQPLKSGEAPLKLLIKVRVENGDYFKDIVVFEKNINVKPNFGYSFKSLLTQYWQWIMTSIVIPFLVWWYNKKKKKKKEDEED